MSVECAFSSPSPSKTSASGNPFAKSAAPNMGKMKQKTAPKRGSTRSFGKLKTGLGVKGGRR